MGQITADQSQAVMATIMQNTPWEEIDFDECGLQNSVIHNPKEAGHQFSILLKNGCRLPQWPEQDGIIYVSVISDGATHEEWLTRLKRKGVRMFYSLNLREALSSPDFTPTSGVIYNIAIFKGELWSWEGIADKVRERQYAVVDIEAACLFCEKFSSDAMGLSWILAPTELDETRESFLSIELDNEDFYEQPGLFDRRKAGLAFVTSKINV
jgi:hypothetical protein